METSSILSTFVTYVTSSAWHLNKQIRRSTYVLTLSSFRNISLDSDGVASRRLDELSGLVSQSLIQIDHHHLGALLGEQQSGFSTDTPRTT